MCVHVYGGGASGFYVCITYVCACGGVFVHAHMHVYRGAVCKCVHVGVLVISHACM